MKITDLTREQIKEMVDSGLMDKKNLKHYDICKELSNGSTAQNVADKFELSDGRKVREIKKKKCPDCGRSRPIH